MNKPTLAERRLELISRCAEERADLADAVLALRPSNALEGPVAGFVFGHKKALLASAAAMLGVMLARRKNIAALAGTVMTGMGMARNVLGVMQSLRR
jgi:hypothetical protein